MGRVSLFFNIISLHPFHLRHLRHQMSSPDHLFVPHIFGMCRRKGNSLAVPFGVNDEIVIANSRPNTRYKSPHLKIVIIFFDQQNVIKV